MIAHAWRLHSSAQGTGNRHHTGLSEWRVKVILSASFPADKPTPDGSLTHSLWIVPHTKPCTQRSASADSAVCWVANDYWILIHLFGSTAVQLPTHLALGESIFIERLDKMALIWSGRVKIQKTEQQFILTSISSVFKYYSIILCLPVFWFRRSKYLLRKSYQVQLFDFGRFF